MLDLRRAFPKRFWLDALGCTLGLLYGVPTLIYPFGADQGIHWYVGYGWLHGEMPYATGISGKPPGIFVVHAIASALFGDGMSAIRVLELLTMPVLGYFVASAGRPRGRPLESGAIGAATLLVSTANYTYADYWNTAHPELWETVCLLAAFHVANHDPRARRRAFAAGALCMAAFTLKYPAAAVALPIAGLCGVRAWLTAGVGGWLEDRRRRALAFAEATAFYVLGMALIACATLLPFALTGTLREMFEVCVDMTVRYTSGAHPVTDWWPGFWKMTRGGTLLIATLAAALLGVIATTRRRDRAAASQAGLLGLLLLGAVGAVVLQGRNWSYHWVSVFPFLVAFFVWGLQQGVRNERAILVLALASTIAAFLFAPRFIAHTPRDYRSYLDRWFDYASGDTSAEEIRGDFERLGRFDRYGVQHRIGALAKQHAQPGDTLCVRGFLSPIYQASGLRCSSRHAIQTFVGLGPPSWKREYADDLRTQPPRFMVTFAERTADLRDLAKGGYTELGREDGLVLLRRP